MPSQPKSRAHLINTKQHASTDCPLIVEMRWECESDIRQNLCVPSQAKICPIHALFGIAQVLVDNVC
jgi:hypothetical protein